MGGVDIAIVASAPPRRDGGIVDAFLDFLPTVAPPPGADAAQDWLNNLLATPAPSFLDPRVLLTGREGEAEKPSPAAAVEAAAEAAAATPALVPVPAPAPAPAPLPVSVSVPDQSYPLSEAAWLRRVHDRWARDFERDCHVSPESDKHLPGSSRLLFFVQPSPIDRMANSIDRLLHKAHSHSVSSRPDELHEHRLVSASSPTGNLPLHLLLSELQASINSRPTNSTSTRTHRHRHRARSRTKVEVEAVARAKPVLTVSTRNVGLPQRETAAPASPQLADVPPREVQSLPWQQAHEALAGEEIGAEAGEEAETQTKTENEPHTPTETCAQPAPLVSGPPVIVRLLPPPAVAAPAAAAAAAAAPARSASLQCQVCGRGVRSREFPDLFSEEEGRSWRMCVSCVTGVFPSLSMSRVPGGGVVAIGNSGDEFMWELHPRSCVAVRTPQGRVWPTAYGAIAGAMVEETLSNYEQMFECFDATEVDKLLESGTMHIRPDWTTVRTSVVRRVLRQRLHCHPLLRRLLGSLASKQVVFRHTDSPSTLVLGDAASVEKITMELIDEIAAQNRP